MPHRNLILIITMACFGLFCPVLADDGPVVLEEDDKRRIEHTEEERLEALEEVGTFLELLKEGNDFGLSEFGQEMLESSAEYALERLEGDGLQAREDGLVRLDDSESVSKEQQNQFLQQYTEEERVEALEEVLELLKEGNDFGLSPIAQEMLEAELANEDNEDLTEELDRDRQESNKRQ